MGGAPAKAPSAKATHKPRPKGTPATNITRAAFVNLRLALLRQPALDVIECEIELLAGLAEIEVWVYEHDPAVVVDVCVLIRDLTTRMPLACGGATETIFAALLDGG